jgi:hypothetical protein
MMNKSLVCFAGCGLILSASGLIAQDNGRADTPRAESQLQDELASSRRQELIATIVSARETASRRTFSSTLRGLIEAKLVGLDSAALEAFANAGGLGDLDGLVPNALGDSAADLVFTPVTPCRIVNTVATATPLAANTSRAFYVNGNAAAVFEAQGGNAGGCGIPDAATAVEMNFIAVAPAAGGDFRAFPWSATPTLPLASVINYANVPGLNIANGLAQPVCNAATTVCNFDLIVQADVAQSHLIIDVVGYYRNVNKAQVKSFVNTVAPVAANYTDACTNAGGNQINVVAPVAGRIVARMTGSYVINHVTGTTSILIMALGTTATDCAAGDQFIRIEAAWPTAPVTALPVTLTRVLNVAAGSSTTIFLNGDMNGGAGHRLSSAGANLLEATFIPN